ncbi:MAG: hypothetical protein V3W41_16290 [Planctomycetota bacterium]
MATMVFSVFFGAIGFAYFIYGKKQQRMVPLVAGLGLCAFPYVVPNPYAAGIIGMVLTAAPWLIRE